MPCALLLQQEDPVAFCQAQEAQRAPTGGREGEHKRKQMVVRIGGENQRWLRR